MPGWPDNVADAKLPHQVGRQDALVCGRGSCCSILSVPGEMRNTCIDKNNLYSSIDFKHGPFCLTQAAGTKDKPSTMSGPLGTHHQAIHDELLIGSSAKHEICKIDQTVRPAFPPICSRTPAGTNRCCSRGCRNSTGQHSTNKGSSDLCSRLARAWSTRMLLVECCNIVNLLAQTLEDSCDDVNPPFDS